MKLTLPTTIDSFSEADVRAEILDPLLKALGYAAGTPRDIRRELSVSLRVSLGRKKANDPLLRGRIDYMLETSSRRWILEAKPATNALTDDDVRQAYTYAAHPEIRATLFALSNGHEFRVYETLGTPTSPAILSLTYSGLTDRLETLLGLLSPKAIEERYPVAEAITDTPVVAPGYRSPLQIVGGVVSYVYRLPDGRSISMNQAVTDGVVERTANGLLAYVELVAATREMQELNERMGLSRFEARSSDDKLSFDSSSPTRFSAVERVYAAAGEEFFDLTSWRQVRLPCAVDLVVSTTITAYLDGQSLHATFFVEVTGTLPLGSFRGVAKLRVR